MPFDFTDGELPPMDASQTGGHADSALIVDDDVISRMLIRNQLVSFGCRVYEATDGQEAISLVHRHLPDIVLADVMMPDFSGYELLQYLQADARTRDIPVILVTSCSDIEDLERGFLLGAFDFIRKPFNPREFIVRIRNALELKRSSDALRRWNNRLSRELDTAGSLQRKLLQPHPYLTEDFDIRMAYQPSLTVGGDLFDVIPLPRGRICVYVADAAGHGVGAAMVTVLLKALIAETTWEFHERGPARICRELSIRFRDHIEKPEIYATLFLAIYDPQDDAWRCMNCGHPAPFVFESDGDVSQPSSARGEMPLGFAPNPMEAFLPDSELVIPARPGSMIMLYTDGLLEAPHAETGEPAGADIVRELARRCMADPSEPNPARGLLRRVVEAGYRLEDDCSSLSLKRLDCDKLLAASDLPLDRAAVSGFAEVLERRLKERGWPDVSAGMARVLVMEHGNNVIDHGGAPADSALHCHAHLCGDSMRIVFKDVGREWDFLDQLSSALQSPLDSERGRGLRLIRAITKEAEVTRRDNVNTASYCMRRDWEHAGGPGAAPPAV